MSKIEIIKSMETSSIWTQNLKKLCHNI